MIISRTPFRISFFGGGTDYPAWYRKHGGAVLSATIDKYCYLSVRYLPPFFEHRFRVVYSKIENRERIEDIEHPAVRAVLEHLAVDRGVEIHHDADLPARSGMGSSSAFTVGLLNAVHALQGRMPTKRGLALESIHLEQSVLREVVGSQDQVAAAYGGFNRVSFLKTGEIVVRPLTVPAERLDALADHLMLIYTGIRRTAANVAASYANDLDRRERQLRMIEGYVDRAIGVLASDADLLEFGALLDEVWQVKRTLSRSVSSDQIDEIYNEARDAGAIGGKITGAGGGGFMLLFVPPDKQPAVRAKLGHLIHAPFRFEQSGSQIIFYEPESDYAAAERHRAAQSIAAFREMRPTVVGE
jgi:D-glycero-alpha-D-manno-heptose-7-phosphate kinase